MAEDKREKNLSDVQEKAGVGKPKGVPASMPALSLKASMEQMHEQLKREIGQMHRVIKQEKRDSGKTRHKDELKREALESEREHLEKKREKLERKGAEQIEN